MSTTTVSPIGGALTIVENEDGTYEVTQNEMASNMEKLAYNDNNHLIDGSISIVRASGFINDSTFDIAVDIFIAGLNLGSFAGTVLEGLNIRLDLPISKGQITFFLKNGNEIYMKVQLRTPLGGPINETTKLLSL